MSKIIKRVKEVKEPVNLGNADGSYSNLSKKTPGNAGRVSLDFNETITSEVGRIKKNLSQQISIQSEYRNKEMKQMSQNAYDDGYKAGFDDAIEKERSERVSAIDMLLNESKEKSENAIQGLELKVIDLAVFLAEQITRKNISAYPEIIEGIIEETMSYLIGNENIVIKVSEEDFKLVNSKYDKWLNIAGSTREFRLEVDRRLKQGDCIIETEGGIIDAAVKHRLDTIAEELVKASSGDSASDEKE